MFCEKCGTKIPEGDKKCPSCGANTGINKDDVVRAVQEKSQDLFNGAKNLTNDVIDQIQAGDLQKNIQNKSYNMLALVGSIIAFVSVFLPMYKASAFGFSQTISLFGMEKGLMALILMALSGIGVLGAILKKTNLTMLAGVLYLIVVIFIYILVKNELGIASSIVKTTIGFYCMLAGAISMICSHFIKIQ